MLWPRLRSPQAQAILGDEPHAGRRSGGDGAVGGAASVHGAHKNRFGDFPLHEKETSLDQFSALKQVIQAGAAPYTDFSFFGPHGLRLLQEKQPGPGFFPSVVRGLESFEDSALAVGGGRRGAAGQPR